MCFAHASASVLLSPSPRSIHGPKGEGDKGGEGSPVGPGASPQPRPLLPSFLRRQEPRHTHPQPNPVTILVPATLPPPNCSIHALDPDKHMYYIIPQPRPDTHFKEEPNTTGKPPRPNREDSTSKPIPKALAQARGSSESRHLFTKVSCPLPLSPGDGRRHGLNRSRQYSAFPVADRRFSHPSSELV